MTLDTPIHSQVFNSQGPPTRECFSELKTAQNESLQGGFLCLLVPESRQMAHPALTWAFLQPAATAAMHCQPEGSSEGNTNLTKFFSVTCQWCPKNMIKLTDAPNRSSWVHNVVEKLLLLVFPSEDQYTWFGVLWPYISLSMGMNCWTGTTSEGV